MVITQHVPIDKVAADDRLRACDAIHLSLTVLLKEADEGDGPSGALINAMSIQLEFLDEELHSLREIVRLSGEVPSEPRSEPRLCACEAMRKLQEAGLS